MFHFRQQIQEALNKQTYHQFLAYAQQTLPGEVQKVCYFFLKDKLGQQILLARLFYSRMTLIKKYIRVAFCCLGNYKKINLYLYTNILIRHFL